MKTKSNLITCFFFISFLVLTSVNKIQDTSLFEGAFDGHEDYGYNFIGVDEDGGEYTMTFQEVDAKVMEDFNLDIDDLIGTKFSVTYKTKTETIKDEDGFDEDIETLTIVGLEKL
ncbi:MAG: hypothetical protein DA407_00375 [Bacteroidetes bacterium]|nr:MAG: hypothetical protein DA407_00375 [Bacteroidota bacterium]